MKGWGGGRGVCGGLEEGVNEKAMGVSTESTLNTQNSWRIIHLLNHKRNGLSDFSYVGPMHIVNRRANGVSDHCYVGLVTVGLLDAKKTLTRRSSATSDWLLSDY